MTINLYVRPAEPADYADCVLLQRELGIDDPVPPCEQWKAERMPQSLVIEQGGRAVGFVQFTHYGDLAHIEHLAVQLESRRQGLGQLLMIHAAERLRKAGAVRWFLNVKPNNEPAIALYERLGLRRAFSSVVLRLPPSIGERLLEPRRPLSVAPISTDEDQGIESAFGLPHGRLSQLRSRPSYILLRLVDGGRPHDLSQGFAAFDPSFPGAYPFRVAAPPDVGVLVRAMHQHLPNDVPYVQVVVEGQDELADLLVSHGAVRYLDLWQMRGPLP